jgi:hypothetical protein
MSIGGTGLEPSSGGGGINYSTTEQDTGLTWLGGETIYQKTIAVTCPNNTLTTTAHGITGVDVSTIKIVLEGSGADDGTTAIPLPYVNDIATFQVLVSVNATNISLRSSQNMSAYSGHVTLQYAKI